VLHLSSTGFGGGVAEILVALVPLMRDVGLTCEWRVISGRGEFFDATKAIHNALQGGPTGLSAAQREVYRATNWANAAALEGDFDVVIVHDAQPAAIIEHARPVGRHWVWRCHIDLSEPNDEVVEFLAPWLARYDAAVYHRHDYAPASPALAQAFVWPPAIDPLAPKNMALSTHDAAYILDQFGIEVGRPLLAQISRFDPWKDPLGVIDSFRLVRESRPGVQLALVGSMAHDDPEGWEFYERTVEHAENDPDIHILSNLNNVGAVEVNAFQVHSSVVLQKSIREGFGLTVTEALWKARPVVAGRAGGIVDQVQDGQTGLLVDTTSECAAACLTLLEDPVAAHAMALAGKEHVRKRHLMPRLLRDWLLLITRLVGDGATGDELLARPRA
jgi:trehalose synthase